MTNRSLSSHPTRRRHAVLAGAAVVVDIVDTEEKVNSLLPALDEMMGSGLVTLEKVKVIQYRHLEEKK